MTNLVEGYYTDYSYVVTSVNGKADMPVTEFVSREEALEYYMEEHR